MHPACKINWKLIPLPSSHLTSHRGLRPVGTHAKLMPSSYQFKKNRAIVASSTASELCQKSVVRLLSDNRAYSPYSTVFKTNSIRNLGDVTSCICNTCFKNPSEILGDGVGGRLIKHLSGKLEAKQKISIF